MGMWNDYVQGAMKEGAERSSGFGRANNRSRITVTTCAKRRTNYCMIIVNCTW
jgi:hypothetical protein